MSQLIALGPLPIGPWLGKPGTASRQAPSAETKIAQNRGFWAILCLLAE